MNPRQALSGTDEDPIQDITHYRSLVGRNLCLTITSHILSLLLSLLVNSLQLPRTPYLQDAHHVLSYIRSSPRPSLLFSASSTEQICGFYICRLGDMLGFTTINYWILCLYRWLPCLLEIKEANNDFPVLNGNRHQAFTAARSEVIWLQQLLQDFQIISLYPSVLYCDNQARLHIASNLTLHERMKHK